MEDSWEKMGSNYNTNSSAPGYNLLDHPEVLMRQQSMDFDTRRILDSYSARNMIGGSDPER